MRQILLLTFFISFAYCAIVEEPTQVLDKPLEKIQVREKRAITNTTKLCYCKDLRINCDLKTACVSDCKNTTRYAEEVDCVFPFQYKGVWYDTCTDADSPGQFWCSVDRVFANKYAFCEQKCPYLARKLVGTSGNHTSCRPTGTGWVPVFPDDSEIKAILDIHNYERSIVSPPAANMRMIYWDFALARLALSIAMTGDFNHDCSNCRRLLNNGTVYNGQNLYMSWGRAYSRNTTWKSAIGAWVNEKVDYKYGIGSFNGGVVGHYTQFINAAAVRVGCAAAINNATNSIYAACNYASGQSSFAIPYTNGTVCTGCSDCVNNMCRCNKICQNSGTLDISTCTCKCLPYATGAECEILLCDKTDQEYGCWGAGDTLYCRYSNTKPQCPHTCGVCTYN